MYFFVIAGCQSLFLRQTQTGECIASSEKLAYNGPNHAFPYYVVMTDNCLDVKAQFRYLTNWFYNIEKEGTLIASPSATYKNRWAVYKGVSKIAKRIQSSRQNYLKQTSEGSLLFYHRNPPVCAEPSSGYVFSKKYCNRTKQMFTLGK